MKRANAGLGRSGESQGNEQSRLLGDERKMPPHAEQGAELGLVRVVIFERFANSVALPHEHATSQQHPLEPANWRAPKPRDQPRAVPAPLPSHPRLPPAGAMGPL